MSWLNDAICSQTDPEAFFPEKGGTARIAKAVCAKCPVIEQCREYAIHDTSLMGVWGGTSEMERRAIRSERGISNDLKHPDHDWVVALYRDGYEAVELAKRFGITDRTVYRWVRDAA